MGERAKLEGAGTDILPGKAFGLWQLIWVAHLREANGQLCLSDIIPPVGHDLDFPPRHEGFWSHSLSVIYKCIVRCNNR